MKKVIIAPLNPLVAKNSLVAGEHDPVFADSFPDDLLILQVVPVQAVEAGHAKQSRQLAQVNIQYEAGFHPDQKPVS